MDLDLGLGWRGSKAGGADGHHRAGSTPPGYARKVSSPLHGTASALALVAVLAGPAHAGAAGGGAPCDRAITPENAETIFSRLTAASADGCSVEGAKTERTTMVVTWRSPDGGAHDVVLQPASCAGGADLRGPEFAAITTAAFRAACPGAHRTLAAVLASGDLGRPAVLGDKREGPAGPSPRSRTPEILALAALVAAAIGVAVRVVLRRRRRVPGTTAPAPRSRRRRGAKVALGVVGVLVVLEIACRVFVEGKLVPRLPGLDGSFARPDAQLGFVLVPGDYDGTHINQLGLRGPEVQPQKAPGCRRILALGGSTTYGNTVTTDEAYPAVLERLLAARTPAGCVEVINAGLPGASSAHHVARYRAIYAGLAPDVVTIYVGWNDYGNYLWLGDDWSADGLEAPSVLLHVGPVARVVLRGCALCRVIYGAHRARKLMRGLDALRAAPDGERYLSPATAALRAHLETIIGLARSGGAEVVLVKFPSLFDPARMPEERRTLEGSDAAASLKRTAHLVATSPAVPALVGGIYDALAEPPGVEVVDCSAPFYRLPVLERARLFDDAIHPNAAGYRLIAACLAEAL